MMLRIIEYDKVQSEALVGKIFNNYKKKKKTFFYFDFYMNY